MNKRPGARASLVSVIVLAVAVPGCSSQAVLTAAPVPTAAPTPGHFPQTAAPPPSPGIPAQWWAAACAVAADFAAMSWLKDVNSLPKTHPAVADARKTVDEAQSDSIPVTGWAPGEASATLVRIALTNYALSLGNLDTFVDSKNVVDYNLAISGLTSGNEAVDEAAARLGVLRRDYIAPPCRG